MNTDAASDHELVAIWLATKAGTRTRTAYEHDASLLLAWLAARGAGLRTMYVSDLVEWLSQLNGAKATIARRVASVRSLLAFGHSLGYLVANVGTVLKVRAPAADLSARILTEEEVRRLAAAAADSTTRALVVFLYATGCRISEALGIRWHDVHLTPDGGAVVSLLGKRDKRRHVRIDSNVLVAIGPVKDRDAPVFCVRYPQQAWGRIARLSKRELGRRIGPHHLRHSHVSHALDRGAPVHLVQATVGHASLATTGRYAHARPGQSSGAYLGTI